MKNDVFYFGRSRLLSYTTAINEKKIKNISPKVFGWVLFKLGSGILCQVRQKMIPSMLLP